MSDAQTRAATASPVGEVVVGVVLAFIVNTVLFGMFLIMSTLPILNAFGLLALALFPVVVFLWTVPVAIAAVAMQRRYAAAAMVLVAAAITLMQGCLFTVAVGGVAMCVATNPAHF